MYHIYGRLNAPEHFRGPRKSIHHSCTLTNIVILVLKPYWLDYMDYGTFQPFSSIAKGKNNIVNYPATEEK